MITIPKGAVQRKDGSVGFRSTKMLIPLGAFAAAIFLFMAIGIPIDMANQDRLTTPSLIISIAIGVVGIAFLAWILWWTTIHVILKVDDEGIHRIGIPPYTLARWEDITEISLNPQPRGSFTIVTPNGRIAKSGRKPRHRTLIIRAGYFSGGGELLRYLTERWQAARSRPATAPTDQA